MFAARVNSLREQLKYIKHIRRLHIYEFGNAMQFLIVGASGTVLNLLVLVALLQMGLTEPASLAGGISASLTTNFLLDYTSAFSYARDRNPWAQFAGFLGASRVCMLVNYAVALSLITKVLHYAPSSLYIAALAWVASEL